LATILAVGHPWDIHVDAVAWGLEQRGHEMLTWNFAEFPGRQLATTSFSSSGEITVAFPEAARHCDVPAVPGGIDAVWRRRLPKPVPSEELPESDRIVALRESQALCEAATVLRADGARWVNPAAAARAANLKPLQLRAALRAGLKIPDTICSNDPARVRDFARKHRGRIICKTFYPASWQNSETYSVTQTALVDDELLANDFAIAAAPAIYQRYIEKQYELRVTVMGAVCVAAKITVSDGSAQPVDARQVHSTAPTVEVELPTKIREACSRLLAELGLVFGCVDLIVDEEDEILFLEVNEMGQFLWLEARNPEIPLLSRFVDFIASGRPDFQKSTPDGVTYAAYCQSERCERARALWDQALSEGSRIEGTIERALPESESRASGE
jgi:hypothetical protein